MIEAVVFDLGAVILFHKDKTNKEKLSPLYKKLKRQNNFQFEDYFVFNMKLLRFLEELKNKLDLFIFTSGTLHKAKEVRDVLAPIFLKIITTEDIGAEKNEVNAYAKLATFIKKNPQEILYIDDMDVNVINARKAGFRAVVFENNDNLMKDIEKFLA